MHHLFGMFLQVTTLQDSLQVPSVGLEEFWSMIAINYLCTHAIQWAKWTDFKPMNWISEHTPWVTRFLAVFLSAATAVGIHKTWEPQTGALLITGLTGPNILHMGKHIVVNYAMQHGWWKLLFAGREGIITKKESFPPPAAPTA